MSRNGRRDDRIDDDSIETKDLFDDSDRRERDRDRDDDSHSSSDDDDSITGMRRGRGRGRGRGRSRDDDSSSNDDGDDSITGKRTQGLGSPKKGYQFDLDDDGNVTSLKRIKKGRTKREKIEAGETWTYDPDNTQLIHREFEATGVEVTTYTDTDQDGIFTRAFKTFESSAAFTVDVF